MEMSIPRGDKAMVLFMLLQILQQTDIAHPIRKEEIRQEIRKRFDVEISRNTLNSKMLILQNLGYEIEKTEDGWYMEHRGLEDGELRILIDSVLYSDLTTSRGASELIEKLMELGSQTFRMEIGFLKHRTKQMRKQENSQVVLAVEEFQKGIFHNHRVSCNYLTRNRNLKPEKVYPHNIKVDPYELAYSEGKYYLLCAIDGSEELTTLRMDRVVDAVCLDEPLRKVPAVQKMQKDELLSYIRSQPELVGGTDEYFTLECHVDALNALWDAFSGNIHPLKKQDAFFDEHHRKVVPDPDTILVEVKTTRKAIHSWAVMHADKVVVIKPESMKEEIRESLKNASHYYSMNGKPVFVKQFFCRSFAEAVRLTETAGNARVIYRSCKEGETVDLAEVSGMSNLSALQINGCKLLHTEVLAELPHLHVLNFRNCEFDHSILEKLPHLENLTLSFSDANTEKAIAKMPMLKRLSIANGNFTSLRFLCDTPIQDLTLYHCPALHDLSALKECPELKKVHIHECENVDMETLPEQFRKKE